MNNRKLLLKLLSGKYQNVAFADFQRLIISFGFYLDRVVGSHHIYIYDDIDEIVNLQNVHGQAKAYQIKQVMKLVEVHHLMLGDE